MKRIRKFRGKSSESRKWVYGYLFEDIKPRYRFAYIIDATFVPALSMPSSNFIEVIPETVGQFTGFKDKSGKDIYEDDKTNGDEIVIFKNGAFRTTYTGDIQGGGLLIEKRCKYIEIIGNIHDKQ